MALKSVAKKKKKGLTLGKIVLFILITGILVAAGLAIYYLRFYTPTLLVPNQILSLNIPGDTPDGGEEEEKDYGSTSDQFEVKNRKKEFYNILVVGRDIESRNTDVIMLMSFDNTNKKVAVMQIPRDTYISTSSSTKKINSQFQIGYNNAKKQNKKDDAAILKGVSNLATTITAMLGVPVDRYVYMDLTGFRNIVDILGGVEVDLPFAMKYSDPYQDLYIDLPAGINKLDGAKAEGFVRFRKTNEGTGYIQGDIGRIQAQKIFMSALIGKMKTAKLNQLIKMIGEVTDCVQTNCKPEDMRYFIENGLKVGEENISFHTLPGEGQYVGNLSYYTVHAKDTLDLVNLYYNPMNYEVTADKLDIVKFDENSAGKIDEHTAADIIADSIKIPFGKS